MTCTFGVISASILGLVAIAFALQFIFRFGPYCNAVAQLQGRQAELSSPFDRDEGGANAFQREMFWELLCRDYEKYGNDEVAGYGRRATEVFWRCIVVGFMGLAMVLWLMNSSVCI